MKILKYILYGIVAIVAIFLVIGLFAPKHAHIERSVYIKADKSNIMNLAMSLKKMNTWSPWPDKDPNMKVEYSGKEGEVGSGSSWESEELGVGSQTVKAISENRIDYELSFKSPMEGKASAAFDVEPSAEGFKTTWSFDQDFSYPMNAMGVFMNMDKMLGTEYERGLVKLKSMCEKMASEVEIHEVDFPGRTLICKRATLNMNEISQFYAQNLGLISKAVSDAKLNMSGPPTGLFFSWDDKTMSTELAACIPVSDQKAKVKNYETVNVPGGKALHVAYKGAYDKMEKTYDAVHAYMKEKGIDNSMVLEEYASDPMSEKDTAKWLTNIYFILKPASEKAQ
jgi:effector-binding domain-containing protein